MMYRFFLCLLLTFSTAAHADFANKTGYPSDELLMSPHFYDDMERAAAEAGNVQFLDLGMRHPKLTKIPAAVYTMRGLKYLSVSFNRVARIGDDISALTDLEELYLQGNHYLHSVSDEIGKLQKLRLVHVADTGLSKDKITKLRGLLPAGCKLITTH